MGAAMLRSAASEAREPLVAGDEPSSCWSRCLKRRRTGATGSGFNVVLPPHWVLWTSIDPRSGQIQVYPKEVSQILERALKRGDAAASLGDSFFGATVELTDPGGAYEQRTARGGRDVRRVLLQDPRETVTLRVRQGRYRWSAVDGDDGHTQERTARAPEEAVDLNQLEEERERERPPPDEREGVALWQWCHELHVTPAQAEHLEDCFWGIYTEQQNREIEDAYQAAERQLEITVGVRQYQVVFGPAPGFARQEDQRLRKRRLMRRRWLSESEFCARMTQDLPASTEREQDECILCLCEFADTAHMPVVELPECKHVFHRACAQQLVDARGRCPCCRAEVDWSFLTA